MLTKDFPLRHLSIRVPWHDSGWTGTVCKAPKFNGACLKLPRISESRNDLAEQAVAGKCIKDLDPTQWPCCMSERVTFMADFEFSREHKHPYCQSSPDTHSHFAATPLRYPAYSAAALPFRWMMRETADELAEKFGVTVDLDNEPELPFHTNWIQAKDNHQALLECFWNHIRFEESLCFFYAKQVPFVEDTGRRVLIGVGRVKHIGPLTEYVYSKPGKIKSLLWERLVQHSIRPGFKDGFLFPYHQAIAHAEANASFDPGEIVAFAPEEHWGEFSFATEHVTHDGAIAALLATAKALKKASEHLEGNWSKQRQWVDTELGRLWKRRGPCPGLGSALGTLGITLANFVAQALEQRAGENKDPWPVVDAMFKKPEDVLAGDLMNCLDDTICKAWQKMTGERKALLRLLSRFDLTKEQAKMLFVQEDREKAGLMVTDAEILRNPYRIYEATRLTSEPVGLLTIDRGVFPPDPIRTQHPLPEETRLKTGVDARRIRALSIKVLEDAADSGSTLLPRKEVIKQIRELPLDPECEVTGDTMQVAEDLFKGALVSVQMKDKTPAHQLARLNEMSELIRKAVTRRLEGTRHGVDADWRKLLDAFLNKPVSAAKNPELEQRARQEKAVALRELAESRFSVLIGSAGTGKTTLLSVLCNQEEIKASGVLLLAPTGKARVRMEALAKAAKGSFEAFTLAQFLNRCDRFNGRTFRYQLSGTSKEKRGRTVIVDESSMLTEEMLAALLDSLTGVDRLILVGDPMQLPPIGPGRPFVDIVAHLEPPNVHALFPRVSKAYAELTVPRRQEEEDRTDLQLASWFSGRPLGPAEDAIFDLIFKNSSTANIRFVPWSTPDEFQQKLLQVMDEELKLGGDLDWRKFGLSLGGKLTEQDYVFFNRGETAAKAESWQILAPVRQKPWGVQEINRLVHKTFKARTLEAARKQRFRKIPKPMGSECIVYGDKVINVRNHRRDGNRVFPKEGAVGYLANGEIGIVVGQFRTKNMQGPPKILKVEFSSQPGFAYDFYKSSFGDEGSPDLELAYSLTVHKAQGSEFDLVILVLPENALLMSRELLYTALTRQKQRVVVMLQGSVAGLQKFSQGHYSDTASRLTNLFFEPSPQPVKDRFLEEHLIHRTAKGIAVRSKSELIIADQLTFQNILYEYELKLELGGTVKYPDFTIEDEERGVTYFWEHCGMMHVPSYRDRWKQKLQWYRQNGVVLWNEPNASHRRLIVTEDEPNGGISSQNIAKLIRDIFR